MPRRRMVRFIIPSSCIGVASLGSHAAPTHVEIYHPMVTRRRSIPGLSRRIIIDAKSSRGVCQKLCAPPIVRLCTPLPMGGAYKNSALGCSAWSTSSTTRRCFSALPPTQRDAAARRRPKAVERRRPHYAADPMPPTLPMAPDAAGPWESRDTDPARSVSLAASGPPPPKRGWPCAYPPPLHPH